MKKTMNIGHGYGNFFTNYATRFTSIWQWQVFFMTTPIDDTLLILPSPSILAFAINTYTCALLLITD